MTRIDQFESVFKAAERTLYEPRPVEIRRVLAVTDLDEPGARRFADGARAFLEPALGSSPYWTDMAGERGETVEKLLAVVDETRPDLICTYRNLHSSAWRLSFTLGAQLDVLTQAVPVPILVLPHPEREEASSMEGRMPRTVMALTDHLTGEAKLIDWAVRFTAPEGNLCLAHVEDRRIFERYMEAISKIQDLDTETARERIAEQLLKDPGDYISSCKQALREAGSSLILERLVRFGDHLEEIERWIAERGADLLVINTKDQDQLAMHGLAYPLVVELRATPILML